MPEASLESLKLLPGWHLLQTFNHTSKPASVKGFIQASPACPIHRSLQADFHKCIFFTPDSICSHRHLIHQVLHFCEQTFSLQGMLPFDTKRLWSARNPSSHSQQGRWRHDSVMPAPPRDRVPWHLQPRGQGWLGDPTYLQVLLQQRLPASPISQAGWSPLGKPLVTYSAQELPV